MSIRSLTLLAIAAGVVAPFAPLAAEDTSTATPSTSDLLKRIDDLDQRLRISDRKAELASEAAAEKAKTAVVSKVGEDGFSVGTADGLYRLKIGLLVQADGRFYLGDANHKLNDTFLIRRGIPTFDAQLGKYVRGYLQPNFASGGASLLEAWADIRPIEEVGLKVGKYKTLGLEYTNSTSGLTFPERGLPTNLVPQYDTGAFLGGTVAKALTWNVGVFNGAADGQVRETDTSDDSKDGVARVDYKPFVTGESVFKGLNLSLGGSYGQAAGTATELGLTSGYKSPGQATIFSYAATSTADGRRQRITPALEWYIGNIGLLAEYTQETQNVRNGTRQEGLTHQAWQVVGSYVLTGEAKSASGVKPKRAFDPANGGWGAWEVAARFGQLLIDQAAFDGGYASRTTSVSQATSAGVGVNWWATKNLKWQLSYDLTTFRDGGTATATGADRDIERALVTRVQTSF
jgi:phosphate-selective porin OprO/OprP